VPRPSATVESMPRSGIREIMDLAWATPGVIHLEVGEPNFATPPHVIEAADRAAREGYTKYTPNAGLPQLREALAEKLRSRNRIAIDPDQVVVTHGAVGALFTSLLALLEPGDGILLPDPGWPNYRMMAELVRADARYYPLTPEGAYLPQLTDLERLLGPHTRVLLLNTPSNPLGAIIPEAQMRALLAFAADHDLWVISDECYDEIVFDGSFVSAGALAEDERVVAAFSFSKTYAMTGWRVGYAAVPKPLAADLTKLQEPVISNVNAPAQMAALAAVTGPQQMVREMTAQYRTRRDQVLDALTPTELRAFPPSGAFYLWIDVTACSSSSMEFARTLIREDRVSLVPGTAFGPSGEGAVRLSLATSSELLLEGARRMSQAARRLIDTSYR
jgi:aspartate aminotransferase